MASRSKIDELILSIDEIVGCDITPINEDERPVYLNGIHDEVEEKICKVALGTPITQLLYLFPDDFTVPRKIPRAEARRSAVHTELLKRGFRGDTDPEPGINAYHNEGDEEFTFITTFRWLGNAVCHKTGMVAIEKNITKNTYTTPRTKLGQETEVLLINKRAQRGDLLPFVPDKTINKFIEYRQRRSR